MAPQISPETAAAPSRQKNRPSGWYQRSHLAGSMYTLLSGPDVALSV